jgi:membrane protease YdiL (CAAX protease family)
VTALLVIAGCVVLAARPALLNFGHPALVITALFLALLALALTAPAPRGTASARTIAVALTAGVLAFAVGRLVGGGHAPVAFTARLVALNSLAAVAEEAFFRRVVYGLLARTGAGAAFAVVGAAVLFALVHVSIYGAWVVPIDLAAGLVFGWQRWATGSWQVPAATHVVANVLVVV